VETTTENITMLPRKTVSAMASEANRAIDSVLVQGSQAMISPPRAEVGFVAAVTLGGIGHIAKTWTSICKGHGLTIQLSGVFCHAAPMVKFTDAKGQLRRCELADLLVVVDITNYGSFIRRAALIQAKMARALKRVSLSGLSSRVQLDLYQHWPRFDFEEAAYKLNHIDFRGGGAGAHSGTFGVIDRHLTDQPVWTQHPASPTPAVILNQSQLGEFIAEMVDGTRAGFGRLATPSLQTDWSEVVERLLTVTYKRAFHHKTTLGPAQAPRGVNAIACLNSSTMANMVRETWGGFGGGPPFDDVIVREDDRQPLGINTLHITIGQALGSGRT
jgi:hypothetical protein